MRVALFVTCLTDGFLPRAAVAAVKVLEHLGHDVAFPEAQTCCGQAHFNNGYHDEVRPLARQMIRVFEPYEAVVTPSGSCAAMVRKHFAEVFVAGSADHTASQRLADRTFEFCEFLVEQGHGDLAALDARWDGTATYHPACHLRSLGADETERLATGIKGLEMRPLPRREQCCGFGGTFAVNYGSISGTMVRDKVQCAVETGAETLIVNEAGCSMNIGGACHRQGANVRIASMAEVIAESLGLLGRPSSGEPTP
ncbi:MAG: (Fe-S)-binding protein [Planctomycetota bacterium]|jgi:L-lactate dehydrogenase complex protein LldE